MIDAQAKYACAAHQDCWTCICPMCLDDKRDAVAAVSGMHLARIAENDNAELRRSQTPTSRPPALPSSRAIGWYELAGEVE